MPSSEQDPEKFGIFDMHELGFVRGNLIRDVASLNKHDLGSNPFNADWKLIGIFIGFTFGIGWRAYLQPKIMPLGES